MPLNLEPGIRQALAEALAEVLSAGAEARLPGFGTLRVVQHTSRMEQEPEGGYRLHPPRRTIVFDGEKS